MDYVYDKSFLYLWNEVNFSEWKKKSDDKDVLCMREMVSVLQRLTQEIYIKKSRQEHVNVLYVCACVFVWCV